MLSQRRLGAAPVFLALALGLATSPGCGSSPAQEDPVEGGFTADPDQPATDADPVQAEERTRRVAELLEAGELENAHALLVEVLIDRYLEEAAVLMADNNPEEGLLAIDDALSLDDRDRDVLFLKAKASLQLAEKGMAQGKSALFVEGGLQDALNYYRRVRERPEAAFGAAKAAWLLGDIPTSLNHARAGLEARAGEASDTELRTYVDITFTAYTQAKPDEERADEAYRLFGEIEGALGALLGRAPGDVWVVSKLSDLYEWEEKHGDARSILEQGLAKSPSDAGLLERLTRVTRTAADRNAAVEAMAAHNAAHPDNAVGLWYEARERFEAALEVLGEEAQPVAGFEQAEELFAKSRAIEPNYEASCKGYEVMCRSGVGWCHYWAGKLASSRDAFLSMQDVLDRGAEWKIDGRLSSGIQGLEWVGAKYNERSNWEAAARTFSALQKLQPDEARWANNTGFFFRDAAVDLELDAYRLCQAAKGAITEAEVLAGLRTKAGVPEAEVGTARETELFHAAAEKARARALGLIQESLAAYKIAAELASDDVRIVNDTALILVYYTRTEIDLAESLLMRCVDMGAEQLADETLDEEVRWELENAWGDAHQNLGILHANLRGDFETAATWFAKAVEIGPDPRPVLTGFWLPYVKGERQLQPGDERIVLSEWAAPCGD